MIKPLLMILSVIAVMYAYAGSADASQLSTDLVAEMVLVSLGAMVVVYAWRNICMVILRVSSSTLAAVAFALTVASYVFHHAHKLLRGEK